MLKYYHGLTATQGVHCPLQHHQLSPLYVNFYQIYARIRWKKIIHPFRAHRNLCVLFMWPIILSLEEATVRWIAHHIVETRSAPLIRQRYVV